MFMMRVGEAVSSTFGFIKNLKFGQYCRRKSYSQASVDVALIVINAAHLTDIIRKGKIDKLYYFNIGLVCFSILLELCIGLLIFVKERYSLNDHKQHKILNLMNNMLLWLIFISVVVHVFVCVFVESHYVPYNDLYKLNRNGSCT